MSANYLVDLGNTTQQGQSITPPPLLSGGFYAVGSGAVIGQSINTINANSFCNVQVAGVSASGQLRVQIQGSDTDVSGNYTDPTSGLPVLPTNFQSGGILFINSGGTGGGVFGAFVSGQALASGFTCAAGFQLPNTFVRANLLSEGSAQFAGAVSVTVVSQLKTTGSGGGFSYSPGSGVVNV